MNAVAQVMDAELKLKKAHVRIMRHPETCLYSGIILLGETQVVDDVPTACTDGINTYYGREFLNGLTVEETVGLVLHENLHKLLKHISRHTDLSKKNHMLANMAMDYVVNDVITQIAKKHPDLVRLPDGALYDPMFHDWSVRQVWDYLYKEQEKIDGSGGRTGKGGGSGGQGAGNPRGKPLDDHDFEGTRGANGKDGRGGGNLTPEQQRELEQRIGEALQQGGILAGKFGANIPRVIKAQMEPEIRWEDVLSDFWSDTMRGMDEFTFRRFNTRRLSDDLFMPTTYSDTLGEIVIAIDTSGSIDDKQISRVVSRVVNLCELYPPSAIRILWWDTQVHGEQRFEGNYNDMPKMLKPMGGGGTRVSCVSAYMDKNSINADAIIVFTDGHVEHGVKWDVACPTLWLVTHNKEFTPPHGRKVMVQQ